MLASISTSDHAEPHYTSRHVIVFETIGKRVQMVSDMDSNDVGSIWYCYTVIPAHLGLTAVLTGHEFEEYYSSNEYGPFAIGGDF